ncbi:MAG: SDR family oxidoreductase [Alphaproteobacteria bacterium]|nr:SDR family oxidoreductase [Alphaproteobacteria bacterium]
MKNIFSVEGKVALVTGGSSGIGLMIARGFVANGVKTYISSRKAQVCDEVAAKLSEHGTCLSLPGDLSEMSAIDAVSAEILKREGKLDILVNNAGATWGAPIDEFPESGWDKVMDLNVKSIFFLTKALLPALRAAASAEDPARVINIGSIDGLHVNPIEHFPYSAAKAGVHHLTRALARRLAPENITVNAIAPGPFESKMMAETLRNYGDQIAASNPRGRIGTAEDIAGTAIYLASRAGAYTNGVILPVDGGIAGCS